MNSTNQIYNKLAWLGTLPKHWQVVRLANQFRERTEIVSDKDFKALSVTMKGIVPQLDNIAKTDNGDNRKKVCIGDFVINSRSDRKGSGGISLYEGSVSVISNVLKANSNYDIRYSNYLFTNKLFQEEYYFHGKGIVADMWSTKYQDMRNICIPLPPKNEQQKISNYLDETTVKINHFIAKKQQFIALLKEQRQSVINEAVTKGGKNWITKRLKYISDLRFSNVDKHTIEGEEIVRLCNYVDVYKNDFITNDMELMKASATLAEIDKFKVLKNDIIITKDSETPEDIAVPTLVVEDLENVVCGYHLALIRADETQILSEYLFRVFQSKKINSHFRIGATGVTRVGLSLDDITGVSIPFPKSLEQQTQIVNHIKTETATIVTAIAKTLKEMELIKEYKEAMIAEAVMGKINFNKKENK
jgi:type I restriction enzyme, S subunit